MAFNNDYDAVFEEAGKRHDVDPALIKTVFHIESGGNVKAPYGSSGEVGPMQFMPKTAAYLGVKNPWDMAQAADGAAKYLAEGLDATKSAAGALAYYNSGKTQNVPNSSINYANRGLRMYGNMPLIKNPTQKPDTSGAPSTDDIMTQLGVGGQKTAPSATSNPAPATVSQTPSAAPAQPATTSSDGTSVDDIMSQLGVAKTAPAQQPATSAPQQKPAAAGSAPPPTDTSQPPQEKSLGQLGMDYLRQGKDATVAGFKQGFNDIDNRVSNWSTGLAQKVDEAVPLLGKLDSAFGFHPQNDLQKQIADQNTANTQYESQYGSNPVATVGRFAGNTAALAPVTVPLGAYGAGLGAAVKGVPYVGNLLQGAVRVGTGAAQGVAGAAIAGEDPTTGAIIGGAIPGGASALAAGSRLAGAASKLAGTILDHPLGQAGAAILSGIVGGSLPHAALGGTGAQAVGWITKKWGSAIGQKAADALVALSNKGLAAGVPGAAATYQQGIDNPLQPAPTR